MSDFGMMYRVRTKKPHRCEWCGQAIPVGSQVGNYRGIFDGEWQNWYMHPECEEAYSVNADPSEGFSPYDNERPKPEPWEPDEQIWLPGGANYTTVGPHGRIP